MLLEPDGRGGGFVPLALCFFCFVGLQGSPGNGVSDKWLQKCCVLKHVAHLCLGSRARSCLITRQLCRGCSGWQKSFLVATAAEDTVQEQHFGGLFRKRLPEQEQGASQTTS